MRKEFINKEDTGVLRKRVAVFWLRISFAHRGGSFERRNAVRCAPRVQAGPTVY